MPMDGLEYSTNRVCPKDGAGWQSRKWVHGGRCPTSQPPIWWCTHSQYI